MQALIWAGGVVAEWVIGTFFADATIMWVGTYAAIQYATVAVLAGAVAYGAYSLIPDIPNQTPVAQKAITNKQTVRSAVNTKRWHYGRMRLGGTLAAVFETDGATNHSTFVNSTSKSGYGGVRGHVSAYPTGKHKMLHMFLILGSREIEEVEEIWIGEEKFWTGAEIPADSTYYGKYWTGQIFTFSVSGTLGILRKGQSGSNLTGKMGTGTGITITNSATSQIADGEYWVEYVSSSSNGYNYKVYNSPEDCAAGTGALTFTDETAPTTGGGFDVTGWPKAETHIMGIIGSTTTIQVNIHLGTTDQEADEDAVANITEWTTNHRLRGLPYIYIRALFDRESYKGIPAVTVVAKGVKLYDPRSATTVYSNNWALCVRDLLTYKYGYTCDTTEVNNDSIIASANIADESVQIAAGVNISTIAPASVDISISTIDPGVDDNTRLDIVTATNHPFVQGNSISVSGTVYNDGDYFIAEITSSTQVLTWRTGSTITAESGVGVVADTHGRKRMVLTTSAQHGFQINEPAVIAGTTSNNGTYYPYLIESSMVCRMKEHSAKITAESGSGTAAHAGPRFIANGVMDTKDTPKTMLKELLTAGGGACVWTQGKFVLHPGAYAPATRTITIDDLRGNLKVSAKTPRANLFNRVTGTYINPTAKWAATDFEPIENASYETADNGEQITQNIELPFTTDDYMGQRLAKMMLDRSRQQISLDWPGKLTLLDVAVMENIKVTVDQLGMDEKEFRCISWDLDMSAGAVDLKLREEASAAYDWNTGDALLVDPAQNTNLEDPWALDAPTNITISVEPYADYGVIKKRVRVDWDAVADASLNKYVLEYKLTSSDEWLPTKTFDTLSLVDGTSTDPGDGPKNFALLTRMPVETYDFRVRATSAKHTSVWTYALSQAISVMDIQEAVDLLPSGGGAIRLENGTYSISSTIIIPNKDIEIFGETKGAKIVYSGSTYALRGQVTYSSSCAIRNLTIDASSAGTSIYFDDLTGSLTISDNNLYYGVSERGILLYGSGAPSILVKNNSFTGVSSSWQGVYIYLTGSKVTISDNDVINGTTSIAVYLAKSATIKSNICVDFSSTGIDCWATKQKIINNPKVTTTAATSNTLAGIRVNTNGGESVQVTGNGIDIDATGDNERRGIHIIGTSKSTISNNNIFVKSYSLSYITNGIEIGGGGSTYQVDDNIIQGNSIKVDHSTGISQQGITITGSWLGTGDRNTISGNSIDCVNSNAADVGIYLNQYTSDNYLAADNIITNCGTDIDDNG